MVTGSLTCVNPLTKLDLGRFFGSWSVVRGQSIAPAMPELAIVRGLLGDGLRTTDHGLSSWPLGKIKGWFSP